MQAWEQFLQKVERDLGKETVRKWLQPLKVVRFDACNLYLEARDAFQAIWFEEHVRNKVLEGLFNNNQKKIKVHLSVAKGAPSAPVKRPVKKSVEKLIPQQFHLQFDQLDVECIFKNYIHSESNDLTFKLLCQAIGYNFESQTLKPHTELASFNPIYLCGPPGTGKTHLMISCTHALRERGLRALYCRASTFTEHVVSAIRSGEMIKFRQEYRNIDVLLVDDVQVFSRKGATQEEFFHTFNTLHMAGKQIILSANDLPGELQEIEPRLISRFEWGVVLPLVPLDREEMKSMLFHQAGLLDFKLNPRVADFLLDTFSTSTKTLNRALKALIIRAHRNEQSTFRNPPPNTAAIAQEYLSDLIREEEKAAITPERIIQHVSAHFGIRKEDVLSKSQNRESVFPRQLAMYLCRRELKMPYAKIGLVFSRDHSTVMSAIKLIQKGVDTEDHEISASAFTLSKSLRVTR